MKLISLSILLIVLGFSSCRVKNDTQWVVLHEDGCPPGWVDKSDRKSRLNLEGFLKGNDIVPLKIQVVGSNSTSCGECACFTGRSFRVKVYESQVGYITWLGFTKE